MRKKQDAFTFLVSLLLLSATVFIPAQAQVKEDVKTPGTRQAKVKIFKREGATAYMLDTLLTIPEGMSYLEAVKNLKTDSVSFKELGAKAIAETRFSTAYGATGFTGLASDSLRTMVFRTAVPDSLFGRIKAIKVLRAQTLSGDSTKRTHAFSVTISGNAALGKTIVDSMVQNVRFFRVDSVLQLNPDTFYLNETIRVDKAGNAEEIKITRLREKASGEVLESGDYKVIQLRVPNPEQIIVLKKTKNAAEPDKKEALKAATSHSKKEAEAIPIELQLFPNPTNGEVNINFFSKKRTKAQVRVVDSQGKTVLEEDLGSVQGQVYKRYNLARFGKGMYVVQVQVGKSAQAGKVVVE
ncbi:T9SS type A sorting domain-containing protein [Rufibacter sediminis]|uniref:T9SS type A sorting domain-containing protein n=1 Tax=Rufibacter sediminis TaxID=2762756 RepID=A0ABR6VLB6_9BACT|nr:T9SS type A sorting domain-containing protein [Rufibacter sediminis]MBC3538054.1 T9SS type A sorting domain-containing protein [Rufibacter sediminis]